MMSGEEVMKAVYAYENSFKEALNFYEISEYDKAIKAFEKLLDFEKINLLMQCARTLNLRTFLQGMPVELHLFSFYQQAHTYLVKCFLTYKWHDEALNILDKLSLEFPQTEILDIPLFKAKAYIASKQYETASFWIEQMIKAEPKDPLGHTMQAELLFSSGKFIESLDYIAKTLSKNIEHFELWAIKGKAHLELQQYDQAITAFQKAYSRESAYKQAHRKIAGAYLAMNDYKNALLALAKADSSDVKAARLKKQIIFTLWREAHIARENHQPKKAADYFKLIVDFANLSKEQQQKKVLALSHIGDIYFKQNVEFALKQYDAALKLDPNCMLALMGKACVLVKQEKPAQAFLLVEKILAIDPYNDLGLELQNSLSQQVLSNNHDVNQEKISVESSSPSTEIRKGFFN